MTEHLLEAYRADFEREQRTAGYIEWARFPKAMR